MRREEIFEELAKRGDTFVKKADESYIRVMTSNVFHTDCLGSQIFELSYEERADILAAQYLYFEPDFIGLQEVSTPMQQVLAERLGERYSFVETPLGDFKNYSYHGVRTQQNCTPLVYRKDLYEVLTSRFHLFDVLGLWSYHWALYRSKKDPSQRLIHMNLHYFYDTTEGKQMPGVIDVHNELVHLRRHYPTVPILVTGDYNFECTTPMFRAMVEGLQMQSGMLIAEDIEPDGTHYWFHQIGSSEIEKQGVANAAIDHICVTTDLVNVKLHRVLHDELLFKSSDHCARFLDVEIKEKTI
ncbi:MAG: hypothetical protein IKJ35_09330 [Clostridia bacterium]|nr:hypothetical protein [Clostridia bacterium]